MVRRHGSVIFIMQLSTGLTLLADFNSCGNYTDAEHLYHFYINPPTTTSNPAH